MIAALTRIATKAYSRTTTVMLTEGVEEIEDIATLVIAYIERDEQPDIYNRLIDELSRILASTRPKTDDLTLRLVTTLRSLYAAE